MNENLLKDSGFEWGYEVMSPQKDIYTNWVETEAIHQGLEHQGFEPDKQPAWRLVQWGSNKSLAGVKPEPLQDDGKKWQLIEDDIFYKSITLDKKQGVALELNALAEFKIKTKNKESNNIYLSGLDKYWPHLLLAQNIESNNLTEYRNIDLSLDARLLFDYDNKQTEYESGYKKSLHAARFPIAVAVRNTLSKNMFWLMLVVYDSRYEQSGFICQKCRIHTDEAGNKKEACKIPDSLGQLGRWDCPLDGKRWDKTAEKKGTRKMIFRVPSHAFTQDNIHKGEWAHYQIDLLPYIEAGIQAARDNSTLGGFSEALRFYDLSFFSMGWEISGLNHAEISVKNLSLTAGLK